MCSLVRNPSHAIILVENILSDRLRSSLELLYYEGKYYSRLREGDYTYKGE